MKIIKKRKKFGYLESLKWTIGFVCVLFGFNRAIHILNVTGNVFIEIVRWLVNAVMIFAYTTIIMRYKFLRLGMAKPTLYEKERMKDLFQKLQVGLFRTRYDDGKLLDCNDCFAQLLGYKNREECIDHYIASQHYVDPNARKDLLQRLLQSGYVTNFDAQFMKKDQSPLWLRCSAMVLLDENCFEGIAVDVDDSKIREEDLRKLSTAVQQSPCSIMIFNKEKKIEYLNKRFYELTGYETSELIGLNIDILKHQEGQDSIFLEIWNTIQSGQEWKGELQCRKKNGDFLWAFSSFSPIRDQAGEITHFLSIKNDITESKKAKESLNVLQENLNYEKKKLEDVLNIDQKMSSILDINLLVDFVINKATEIIEAEKCSLMLLDSYSKELIIRGAKGLDGKIIKETRIKMGEQISGFVAKTGNPILVKDIETNQQFKRKNRNQYCSKSFISVPIKVHDKIVGVVNITDKKVKAGQDRNFNMTDLKILCTIIRQASIAIENANYYRKLEYLAVTDSITSLYNHRYFVTALDREINRAKRYKKYLSLMMLDIDDFKSFNDLFGHLDGDQLLKEAGRILKENTRSVDIVCRYAGDEFVIILPETNASEAGFVAKKIKSSFADLRCKKPISISIGLADYKKVNGGRIDLIMKADNALMQAKKRGKNQVYSLH